jgi:hypothetical protein
MIPKIPTAMKYHPNPFFILFSIVSFDVLNSGRSVGNLTNRSYAAQPSRPTYLEILSRRAALSRFKEDLSCRSFITKGR